MPLVAHPVRSLWGSQPRCARCVCEWLHRKWDGAQDHFSKYVVAYVVKDQMAATAAHTLRHGYFALFGAPAYLISDQGKAFVSQVVKDLCKLYGVQKLHTSPYHAQN